MRFLLLLIVVLLAVSLAGCQSAPAEQQETGQEQFPAEGSIQEDYLDEALDIIDAVEPE